MAARLSAARSACKTELIGCCTHGTWMRCMHGLSSFDVHLPHSREPGSAETFIPMFL
jgi:hypothetical protein